MTPMQKACQVPDDGRVSFEKTSPVAVLRPAEPVPLDAEQMAKAADAARRAGWRLGTR